MIYLINIIMYTVADTIYKYIICVHINFVKKKEISVMIVIGTTVSD